jgi:carboxyl-terminal processing protease
MQKWFISMFSKKSIPIILLLLLGGVSVLYAVRKKTFDNPASKYERILQTVGAFLEEGHYSPQKIDSNFSEKVFNKFISGLDAEKGYFLSGDVTALNATYGARISDEIHGAKLESFYAISKTYAQRLDEASAFFKQILAQPFDFSVKEDVDMNYDKLGFAKTHEELYDRWRKRLKYMTLEHYVDLLDARDKAKAKDSLGIKGKGRMGKDSLGKRDSGVVETDQQLEQKARQAIYKIMDRNFVRLKTQETADAQFDMLVNAITNTMDPHTDFFPPVEARAFNETMSGHFYGIGAQLGEDDAGNISLVNLLPGGPAFKSGKVKEGDIILKVAQGMDSSQDLSGYSTQDAVKIIRGAKGSLVRLTLKRKDGSISVVGLVRDEIKNEETFARSAVINEGNKKVGYIYLPEFYADFDIQNGARCSVDVAKEVTLLKEQKVDGIILDLRLNGGGSLTDVVKMVGLFIPTGPVVQVRSRDDSVPGVLKDMDETLLYDGPLAVMVDEFSASASEIFAAAIQDYHRGMIIGSTTYGKGTVQRPLELDPRIISNLPKDSTGALGTLKMTVQKFYRISGGSTQLKGVTPDVSLPDQYEYLKERERDDPNALKWDQIARASFQPWQPRYDPEQVRRESEDRLAKDPSFRDILKDAKWLSDQNDKMYSLEFTQYRKDRAAMQKTYDEMEKQEKLKTPLNMVPMADPVGPGATPDTASGVVTTGFRGSWYSGFKSDVELGEAVNIMDDMIKQGNLVKK